MLLQSCCVYVLMFVLNLFTQTQQMSFFTLFVCQIRMQITLVSCLYPLAISTRPHPLTFALVPLAPTVATRPYTLVHIPSPLSSLPYPLVPIISPIRLSLSSRPYPLAHIPSPLSSHLHPFVAILLPLSSRLYPLSPVPSPRSHRPYPLVPILSPISPRLFPLALMPSFLSAWCWFGYMCG